MALPTSAVDQPLPVGEELRPEQVRPPGPQARGMSSESSRLSSQSKAGMPKAPSDRSYSWLASSSASNIWSTLTGRRKAPSLSAEEMHDSISPENWCVTKKDLKNLRADVAAAIKNGTIVPTELDPFDPKDTQFGPSIYTVTDQYLKPITRAAGGMSYALMKNPKGKKCDLFVTHAWQEGVFEFIDKVLNSWPKGLKHAWCCMLSNPQNLDIGHLIVCPSQSPFALALNSASCMLVVPNRRNSIYTRLWCAYEAFLAWEWGKVILTAQPPRGNRCWRVIPFIGLCAVLGGGSGFYLMLKCEAYIRSSTIVLGVFGLTWYPLVLINAIVRNSHWKQFWNCFGAIISAHYIGLLLGTYGHEAAICEQWGTLDCDIVGFRNYMRGMGESSVFFFIRSEFDRVQTDIISEEGKKLLKNFTGSIREATCTEPRDEEHIRDEIGNRTSEVDKSINVLVRAGMSTPTLRAAVELGVDVSGFTHTGTAFAALMVLTSVPHNYEGLDEVHTEYSNYNTMSTVLMWVTIALVTIWSIIYFRAPKDHQVFCYQVLIRSALTLFWPPWYITLILWHAGCVDFRTSLLVSQFTAPLMWVIVIPCSALGLERVARLPRIGPYITHFIMMRGWRSCIEQCGGQCLDVVSPAVRKPEKPEKRESNPSLMWKSRTRTWDDFDFGFARPHWSSSWSSATGGHKDAPAADEENQHSRSRAGSGLEELPVTSLSL